MARQDKTPVQILDIPLPETRRVEAQLLADVVTAPETMGDVQPLIHPDFFTDPDRRGIWETIVDQYEHGRAFDIATLSQVIGSPFLQQVLPFTDRPATSTTALEHATALRTGAAKLRAYISAVAFIQKAVNPAAADLDVLAAAEAFPSAVEGPAPVQTELSLAEAVEAVRTEAETERRARAEGRTTRISSGILALDGFINGGFKAGQLIVLAARPGVGKTSLMLHFAKTAARGGAPVYVSTLEMTGTELGEKFVFSTGHVRPADVASGNLDRAAFDAAAAELSGLPVLINQFSRTLDQIVARITQAVKKGRCSIAFIDYLGLIQDTSNLGGGVKLYQVIAKITGDLKALAKRLGIPVVLLCQLSREAVRDKRSPELYDLRDSGSIEQDADIVLMLEQEYRDGRLSITAWLRKNRGGRRTGTRRGDLGFVLIPNDTYSAFTEGGIVNEDDLPEDTRPAPIDVTQSKYYNPDRFHEPDRDNDEELLF